MSYVAAGRADAYTQEGMHVWDVAAGSLFVREAEGVVLDTEGTALRCVAFTFHQQHAAPPPTSAGVNG